MSDGLCESARNPVIAFVKPLSAPLTVNDTICSDDQALLKAVYVSGISSYNWYDLPLGGNLLASGITYTTPALTQTTTFYVSYQAGGCTSPRSPATAIVYMRPVVTALTGNTPLCAFDTLRLSIDSLPSHAVLWNGPNGFLATVFSPVINRASEASHQGLYTVTLRNVENGCYSYPDSIWVRVKPKPDNIIALNDGPKCAGSDITLHATDIKDATYQWHGPAQFNEEGIEVVKRHIDTSEAGSYYVLADLAGCISDTMRTEVKVFANPIADAGPDTTIIEGNSVQLSGNGGIIYSWDADPYLSILNIPNPVVMHPPIGNHPFALTVYDNNSCRNTDTMVVTVVPQTILEFPNVFTPNGDGVNDTWQIRYIENITGYQLTIFSREGRVVLSTTNYSNDWDGSQNGKMLPAGEYWYQLLHNKKEYKGAITLIR